MLLRPCAFVLLALTAFAGRQGVDDPALRAAIDRFFATQQEEDVAGYLALWSSKADRPKPEQLKYIFDQGDDKYTEVAVVRTYPDGDRVRVRVSATRERTLPPRDPSRGPSTYRTTTTWSLSYVREAGEWKLVREGPAADGVAEILIEATTPEQREQIMTTESDALDNLLINALARRAAAAAQKQAYAVSLDIYELMRNVANRIGNRQAEGEALQNIANTRYFRREFPGALQAYEQRLAIERDRKDEEAIASALLGVGTVRYAQAEYSAAMVSYREALAIQERLGSELSLGGTLISTGNIRYVQGDFDAAIADYTRSLAIHRKFADRYGEANALEGMGRVLIAQGDYEAALEALSGVLDVRKAFKNVREQGTALLSIGDVHFRLGNLNSARLALDESRVHFESVKDSANAGRAWQAVALVDLAAARFAVSEEEYKKSSVACTAAGDKECAAGATVGLGFAQTHQEKFSQGIASYLHAIDAFGVLGRRESLARAEIGLSQALTAAKLFGPAADAAAHARRLAEALTNDDVLWRALIAEAAALRHLRERDRAVAAADAAVAIVDRALETSRLRLSLAAPRDSSAAFVIRALLQADAGDAAGAFETIERMRLHDLRTVLARHERDISRGMTPAERDEERTLAIEIGSLQAQLAREKGLPKPDAERMVKIDQLITEAAEKRSAQQNRLFERLPDLRLWRGLMAPATRADVERLLPDAGSMLVEFVVGDESVLVISARRGEQSIEFAANVAASPRKEIANRIQAMLQPLVLRDEKAWTKAAAALIPGLATTFGRASRAIVIPHDVLWRVPFEALPSEAGYLADTVAITYAPSVTALVRTPEVAVGVAEASAERVELFAIGSPQLSPEAIAQTTQSAPGWALRPATESSQELKAIGGGVDWEKTLVIEGREATEAAIRQRASHAAVIHVAAPFRVNGASPLFSEMLLAPDDANDGTLEAREIINLDFHAKAGVLSDGGALAMLDASDEVPIVAWAWRAAGVPALVMRRWAGDQDVSDTFLTALHARLRAGDPLPVAVRAARTKIQGSGPFHWAAWMVAAW
jgi:tetratricopeptide (TPR) repeat protein